MTTEYKYIHFQFIEKNPKTEVWYCRNKKSDALLGVVRWYGSWRQYCFFPVSGTVYSSGCLEDIADFIAGRH